MRVIATFLALTILVVAPASAKLAVFIKPANLRPDPSSSNTPIRLLLPPEVIDVEKIPNSDDLVEQNGYYKVKTEQGEEGWAWKPNISVYFRDDWGDWIDEDDDCQDARQEVLIEESTISVTMSDDDCEVESGRWECPFGGNVFTDPSDIDIDHMVPLGNAHISGGWAWNKARKQAYANDPQNPEHLLAVEDGLNQSKGQRSPDKWQPPEADYHCQYADDWLTIKERWGLTLTAKEARAVAEMLDGCP